MSKVFINPGHCPGVDPGAVNRAIGVTEADIVRDIGSLVKGYLEAAGCDVMLVQSDNLAGESPAYQNVCATANTWAADIFVSLHCNAAATSAARGTETLVFCGGSKSETLARCIQRQIISSLGTVDRGVKERPGLAVLRRTNMPAVLVELAFISSPNDMILLMEQQDEFARAIARGVTDYFNL